MLLGLPPHVVFLQPQVDLLTSAECIPHPDSPISPGSRASLGVLEGLEDVLRCLHCRYIDSWFAVLQVVVRACGLAVFWFEDGVDCAPDILPIGVPWCLGQSDCDCPSLDSVRISLPPELEVGALVLGLILLLLLSLPLVCSLLLSPSSLLLLVLMVVVLVRWRPIVPCVAAAAAAVCLAVATVASSLMFHVAGV